MKYKALIIDVDGTLVPNHPDGLPSKRVQDAIKQANKKIHIGLASGRPLFRLSHIFDLLSLSGPSILCGGSQVYDTTTKKIVWEQIMTKQDIAAVGKIIWRRGINLEIDSEETTNIITPDTIPEKGLSLFVVKLSDQVADSLIDELSEISTIAVHKVTDWTKGYVGLNITHAEASKQHGILEVSKILGITTEDIIGVGDGYNDFPLLMACGLKVAMGNAVADLKAIADYVVPPVENDGVADLIEKFVLHKKPVS
ncbi:MAG: HAD family hydrolase [bacterium]|nr:HAD family hydrolase [bacterium]